MLIVRSSVPHGFSTLYHYNPELQPEIKELLYQGPRRLPLRHNVATYTVKTDQTVGCALTNLDNAQKGEVGLVTLTIFRPFQGKGYFKEALGILLEEFKTDGYLRVTTKTTKKYLLPCLLRQGFIPQDNFLLKLEL